MSRFVFAAVLLHSCAFFATDSLHADHDAYRVVADHADNLLCRADDLKSITKDHLRRTDCYRKIRGNITLLKLTTAKVRRRANTIRRAKWEKEFNKIDERLCRIGELVRDTYQRSAEGRERALANCCLEIQAILDEMSADLQCMRIALDCPVPDAPALGTPRAIHHRPILTQPAPAFPPNGSIELPAPEQNRSVPPTQIVPQPAVPTPNSSRSILEPPKAKMPSTLNTLPRAKVVPYAPVDSATSAAKTTQTPILPKKPVPYVPAPKPTDTTRKSVLKK